MTKVKSVFLLIITVFLFAFPKGGFKIADIPFTWGYLLLFLVFPYLLFTKKISLNLRFNARQFTYFLTLPFSIYSVVILTFSEIESIGYLMSFFVSIIFFPFLFLILLNDYLKNKEFRRYFLSILKHSIRFVIIFGLIIYAYEFTTGNVFEIPYLTVNAGDYGLSHLKFNDRGIFSKLTSTFSNGNIFGLCMLLLFQLYFSIENKYRFKILFILVIFLTLSRTVWIGLLLVFLLNMLKSLKSLRIVIISIILGFLFLIFLPNILSIFGFDFNFLFDKNLGGRLATLDKFKNITLLGNFYFNTFEEIIYASVVSSFGIIGLFLFIIYIISPLISFFVFKVNNGYYWMFIIYPILCLSDGATLLIPVMAFFWLLTSLQLENNQEGNKQNTNILMNESLINNSSE